jgi:Na+/proline symporter
VFLYTKISNFTTEKKFLEKNFSERKSINEICAAYIIIIIFTVVVIISLVGTVEKWDELRKYPLFGSWKKLLKDF